MLNEMSAVCARIVIDCCVTMETRRSKFVFQYEGIIREQDFIGDLAVGGVVSRGNEFCDQCGSLQGVLFDDISVFSCWCAIILYSLLFIIQNI